MKEIKQCLENASDLKFLREEYSREVIFGSVPDGDVSFEDLMDWLSNNEHLALHMIQVAKKLKDTDA
jgi:hypothetical protein